MSVQSPVASCLLLLLLALQQPASAAAQRPSDERSGNLVGAEELHVGVGLLGGDNFPFSYPAQGATPPEDAGLEGFEVALMNAICERASLNCTAVPLATLDERLQGVANGTVDMTISALSYTPGREAVAHFVRPFYYSSGVALYASSAHAGLALFGLGSKPGAQVGETAGWRGVFTGGFPVGQTLCFVEGYYALPFVLQDFGDDININISPTLDEAARRTRHGDCAALAYDSVTPASSLGLQMLNAPPAYVAPYGVVISQEDAGSELEMRLVWALTGLMNQGNSSEILELEQQWLVPHGVGPSRELQHVVDAISAFGEPLQSGPGKVPATYSLFGTRPGGR